MIKRHQTFLMCLLFLSLRAATDPASEGRALGESLHQKGYSDASPSLGEIEQSLIKNPEQAAFRAKNSHLSTSFEQQAEAGKKDEDPLKSTLAHQTGQRSTQTLTTQPSLKETEDLLKQKHRFSIHALDPVLHPDLTQVDLSEEDLKSCNAAICTEKSQQAVPQIVTCRKSPPVSEVACTKRLILTAIPQAPIIKTVTAHFTVQCFNLVSFSINLKTGLIRESQCDSRGPTNYSVIPTLGDDPNLSQATVELISAQNIGEGGVRFDAPKMPSVANGFSVGFSAFQPKTGKKHRANEHHSRGGHYVWKFTIPQDPILEEHFEGCEALEVQEQSGVCALIQSESQDLNDSRVIQGYPTPVVRDHWTEQRSYVCGEGRNINECQTFMDQGCEQINSECVVLKGGVCLEYENTFRCGVPNYAKRSGLILDEGKLGFLKDQEEPSAGYEAGDFGQGISHFHAMTEMAKPMEEDLGGIGQDPNNPTVFMGNCKRCRVSAMKSLFRDCCNLKGLLQNFLGGCNQEEKQLAIASARQSRCVRVGGRYCSKRVRIGPIKVCTEYRDSYCCYGSKLARIIQEIARQQLGISFGTAQSPNCGPLTADQLSRINFDTPYARGKLSEILGDVQASAEQKFQAVQEAVSKLGPVPDKIKGLEEALAQKSKELKRLHQTQTVVLPLKDQP